MPDHESALALTVLGTATPFPAPDDPCSGYLLSHRDTRIWVDAGSGTLGELQRHTTLEDLDAIWISHLHVDHCADLATLVYGLLFSNISRDPIPLYGPPGTMERLRHFLTNKETPAPVEKAYEFHELHDGHRTRIGEVTLTTRSVEHDMPAFGLHAEADGMSLVYSGDTVPCDAFTELASECDLLLCVADGYVNTDLLYSPVQAGETARRVRAGRLVLTHVGRFITKEEAVADAAKAFSGPVEAARTGRTYLPGR
ncbi:MBL fold metallo-hydrolase [Salininema proteolyticum]|uniref:MBL fold metallo-hydrolase n=1 Tax=Salininema proteolyticum TaxID=1607685 RepID=A0ABV8U276_9ACTN